jgi:hypothetical protein
MPTITYKFDEQGGFVAADLNAKLAAYAYPTSIFASRARRDPDGVARDMIDELNGFQLLATTHSEYLIQKHFAA